MYVLNVMNVVDFIVWYLDNLDVFIFKLKELGKMYVVFELIVKEF